jgi:ABC-type antimicrobial peptide transport system permease subunit
MILSGNHYLVPIGIIIGMPVAYLILSIYFTTTVKNNNMIMPVTMSFKTIALVIGIILACYFGTLLILRKKANRVSMIESLKDNR